VTKELYGQPQFGLAEVAQIEDKAVEVIESLPWENVQLDGKKFAEFSDHTQRVIREAFLGGVTKR
jgi:hypothetical protein